MSTHYDAVIIGGGHNGLTAAAYLAKAGRKVLVLERVDEPHTQFISSIAEIDEYVFDYHSREYYRLPQKEEIK